MKIKSLIAAAALSAVFASSSADAALLAGFNFNNGSSNFVVSTYGTFNTTGSVEKFDTDQETIGPASSGLYAATATLDLSGLVGPMGGEIAVGARWGTSNGTSTSAVSGDPAGRSLAVAGTTSGSIVFSVSTLLAQGITVSYASQRDSDAATTHTWDYFDGTDWVNLGVLSGMTSAFSAQTLNLSAVTAIENQSTVMFRLTYSGATDDAGGNRIDNVQFNALTIIPEPTVALLGGLGLLTLLRRRR